LKSLGVKFENSLFSDFLRDHQYYYEIEFFKSIIRITTVTLQASLFGVSLNRILKTPLSKLVEVI